jgi:hypothetical protein
MENLGKLNLLEGTRELFEAVRPSGVKNQQKKGSAEKGT